MPAACSRPRRSKFLSWSAPTAVIPSPIQTDFPIEELSDTPPSPKIPRPKNPFILFRNDWIQTHRKGSAHHCQDPNAPSLSRQAGTAWRALSAREKRPWEILAEKEKERHARMYPHYRFRPVKRPSTRVASERRVSHSESIESGTASPTHVSTPDASASPSSEPQPESSPAESALFLNNLNSSSFAVSSESHLYSNCQPNMLFMEASVHFTRTGYYHPYARYSLTPELSPPELSPDSGTSERNLPSSPASTDPAAPVISHTSSLAGWDGSGPSVTLTDYATPNTIMRHVNYTTDSNALWECSNAFSSSLLDPCMDSVIHSWQATVAHHDQLLPMETSSPTVDLNFGDYVQLPPSGF